MPQKYYLDTSIWLDFFENRDEPKLPKGKWAHEIVNKIIKTNSKIMCSDINIIELGVAGYLQHEIDSLFKELKPILIFVESTNKEIGKAKDLSLKRNLPKGDALHSLIARDNKAILITLDNHFQLLRDIIKPRKPQDII